MTLDHYEYKRLKPDNMVDLVHLVKKVSNKKFSVSYYRKKYNTPWTGDQYHGWLAYEKNSGKVVSVAASLPFYAVLPDSSHIPITQMIETFTLPQHRGRGLMTHLVKKILEESKNAGTELFFGLLNQNNVHGFVRKLGFKHTATMEYYMIKINTFPFEAICRRCGFSGMFRWWMEKVIDPYLAPKNSVLTNSSVAEGHGGILHDEKFYTYKSFTYNKLCRFDGIDSWLKFDTGLLVGDVSCEEGCTEVQFDQWLSTLKKIAARAGLRKIIFQVHSLSRLGQKLATRFQPNPSWSVCCLAADSEMQPMIETMRFCYGDFETF